MNMLNKPGIAARRNILTRYNTKTVRLPHYLQLNNSLTMRCIVDKISTVNANFHSVLTPQKPEPLPLTANTRLLQSQST